MVIAEKVTVVIASVEINDECQVVLEQHRKSAWYTPEQAEELAEDLLRAAAEARAVTAESLQDLRDRLTRPIVHEGQVVL